MPERTTTEASSEAWDWIMGRRSHLNDMMRVEPGPEYRTQTLAHAAMADAYEAVRALAVIQALDLHKIRT